MLSETDLLVQREHYKDLLRDAEHDRLVRQAHMQDHGRDKLHVRTLDWLGRQLVLWGMSLQRNYGSMTKAAESASLNVHAEELDLECC